jgi:hypothetical protein
MPGSEARSRDLGRRPFLGRGEVERTWPVWAALGLAPLLWGAALGVSYVLVPVSCDLGTTLPLHAVRAVTTAGAAAAAWGSYGVWRAAQGTESRVVARIGFLAFLGIAVATFSTLLIVAEGVANFVVDPCR